MICSHQFVKIAEKTRPRPNSVSLHGGIAGVIVGCVNCGQVRNVWEDGVAPEIVKAGNPPLDEDNAHTS